jgi:transcriptional regulator with XRE-family HTH domain
MQIDRTLSDDAVLAELGARLRRQRLELNRTQAALAHEAGVSKSTVERLEAGESVQLSSLVRVLRALGLSERLELAVPAPLPSPITLLERDGAARQRASGPVAAAPTAPWTWGDEP